MNKRDLATVCANWQQKNRAVDDFFPTARKSNYFRRIYCKLFSIVSRCKIATCDREKRFFLPVREKRAEMRLLEQLKHKMKKLPKHSSAAATIRSMIRLALDARAEAKRLDFWQEMKQWNLGRHHAYMVASRAIAHYYKGQIGEPL